VNMSRIQWRGLALNLPIKLKDFNKMLSINAAVREMLHSHPKIYLENENPRCNVSQVGPASFELAITCDLKPMVTHCQLRIPFFKALQTRQ
jgi:MscS family membrane protein